MTDFGINFWIKKTVKLIKKVITELVDVKHYGHMGLGQFVQEKQLHRTFKQIEASCANTSLGDVMQI